MTTNKNDRPRSMASDILNLVREGTKKWTRTVKAEERAPASRSYRYARMTRERGKSFKEAAAEILPEAYEKVSGNGAYPANARQLMYACRPHIQEETGKPLLSNYFTQTLLPDYLSENAELTGDWDVCFDARGHFAEPHDGEGFGIGTLEVRQYLAGFHDPEVVDADVSQAEVETSGPSGNFGAVLFIEKEGFDPLLAAANIAKRFDIAIMSTKGMSVVACRKLADEMCHDHDIPLLLMHDFDKAGFSIAGTLQRDTRRYEFRNSIKVIDLGLSLDDVNAMRLATEDQHHAKGDKSALMDNMRKNNASEAEIAFMFQGFDQTRSTRRVELNAMTSPQFISFLERKLRKNNVKKIVPDQELLAEAFVELERGRRLEKAAEKLKIDMDDFEAPKDLQRRVRKYLKEHQELRWDAVLAEINEKPKPRGKKNQKPAKPTRRKKQR
jgi:Topoisomerase 6 subunit A/Spo11, Toprim domain